MHRLRAVVFLLGCVLVAGCAWAQWPAPTFSSITVTDGGTIGGAPIAAVPGAGLVQSNGSSLSAATVGTGLTFSGGTLAVSGMCPLGGCAFTGGITAPSLTLTGGATISAAGTSPVLFTSAVQQQYTGNIYAFADNRPNERTATLSVPTSTSNIYENNFQQTVISSGTGTISGEINLIHPYFEDDTAPLTGSVETFEGSDDLYTSTYQFQGVSIVSNVEATGTVANLMGYSTVFTNADTAPGAIGEYDGFFCAPPTGSGSAPTTEYCLHNKDPAETIATNGGVSVGSGAMTPAGQLFIQSSGSTGSSFPLVADNSTGGRLLTLHDNGEFDLGSSGVPTLLSLTGTLQINGTAGASCPAGTVSVATEVVTDGFVVHC